MGACVSALGSGLDDLGDTYEVIKPLGEGVEGKVYLCKHRTTNELVAVKLVERGIDAEKRKCLQREIQLQARLFHVNIAELKQVLLTRKHLGIVMEYVPGGTLWDFCRKYMMSEHLARYLFKQVVAAVEACHTLRIAHRDIKLSNILLDSSTPPHIKLTDFGCAKRWPGTTNDPHMRTFIGTPGYMSPELLSTAIKPARYDGAKADIWALGIMLCQMFFDKVPFLATKIHRLPLHEQMMMRHSDMRELVWSRSTNSMSKVSDSISAELHDLLDKLLAPEEDERLDIAGIKAHPWFNIPLPSNYQSELSGLQLEQRLNTHYPRDAVHQELRLPQTLETMVGLAGKSGWMGGTDKLQVVDIGTLYLGDFTQHLGPEGSRSYRGLKKVYAADEPPPPVTAPADLGSNDGSEELQEPGTPPPPAAAAVAEELSSASSSTAVSTAGGGVQRRRSSIEGRGDVQAVKDVAGAAGMGELAAKVAALSVQQPQQPQAV